MCNIWGGQNGKGPGQPATIKFNQQFNTSKLGLHISSSVSRLVTRETKRKKQTLPRIYWGEQSRAVGIVRPLARTNSASSTWKILDLEPSNTSPPSSTSQSRPVRIRRYGSLHWSSKYRNLAVQSRKYWSLWLCPLSTNISNLLQTNTILAQITRPPQLYCRWQHISQWDSTKGSRRFQT